MSPILTQRQLMQCYPGIGFQTALALARQNHRIIMADKNDLTESKNKVIEDSCNDNIVTKCVDFTSLSSIRNFAQEVKEEERLDVLINNVGVFCLGKERTDDGLQATMQVNHFGPFLLTHLLAGTLWLTLLSTYITLFTRKISKVCTQQGAFCQFSWCFLP